MFGYQKRAHEQLPALLDRENRTIPQVGESAIHLNDFHQIRKHTRYDFQPFGIIKSLALCCKSHDHGFGFGMDITVLAIRAIGIVCICFIAGNLKLTTICRSGQYIRSQPRVLCKLGRIMVLLNIFDKPARNNLSAIPHTQAKMHLPPTCQIP